jgi:hypothetical protein
MIRWRLSETAVTELLVLQDCLEEVIDLIEEELG